MVAVDLPSDFDWLHVDPIGLDRLMVIGRHDGCGASDVVRDGRWFGEPKALAFLLEVSFGCGQGLGQVFANNGCVESGPGGKIASFNGFEPGGFDGATTSLV